MNKGNNKKALVVSTVASTIDQFCMNSIGVLNKDYEVSIAANFTKGNNTSKERLIEFKCELEESNIKVKEIEFERDPFSKVNFLAYKHIKEFINSSSCDVIYCHTPVAAMAVRLAARKARKSGTKVVYTAHGFHFFKGAPLKNWLLYYPVERWLARYTDVIVTINREDYERAKKSFKTVKIEYIPGVGIDTKKFSEVTVDKLAKRRELGLPAEAFVIISVGELNKNKNHETIINAVAKLNNSNVYYIICGQGGLENYLKDLIEKLGLEKQVKLLGYRRDIAEINKISDVFAFPSRREGLGVAALEAMACGLPIVTSNIHGIVDYSINELTGFNYKPYDVDGFTKAIDILMNNKELRDKMGRYNIDAVKKFDLQNIRELIERIY